MFLVTGLRNTFHRSLRRTLVRPVILFNIYKRKIGRFDFKTFSPPLRAKIVIHSLSKRLKGKRDVLRKMKN